MSSGLPDGDAGPAALGNRSARSLLPHVDMAISSSVRFVCFISDIVRALGFHNARFLSFRPALPSGQPGIGALASLVNGSASIGSATVDVPDGQSVRPGETTRHGGRIAYRGVGRRVLFIDQRGTGLVSPEHEAT